MTTNTFENFNKKSISSKEENNRIITTTKDEDKMKESQSSQRKNNKSTNIINNKTSYIINKSNKEQFHSEDYQRKLKNFERIKIMHNRPKYILNIKKLDNSLNQSFSKKKNQNKKTAKKKDNNNNKFLLNISNISQIIKKKKEEEKNKNIPKKPPSIIEQMEMKLKKEEELPKIIPKNFKYFCSNPHKGALHKSLSCASTIERNYIDKESNFMKLRREANIYTANADYINNKKIMIVNKYEFDNNIYRPDRVGKFDMSQFLPDQKKKKVGFIYKTTNFRCGHNFYRCKVCDNLIENDNRGGDDKSKEKSTIFIKYDNNQKPEKNLSQIPLVDWEYINKNRLEHSESSSLIKEVMLRQYEIYSKFLKNNWNELNIG